LLRVGDADVLQQIPFVVTAVAPSEVTKPPATALFDVTPLTAAVTITGSTFAVVHPINSRNVSRDNTKLRDFVLLVRIINVKSILVKVICVINKTEFRIKLFFR